MQQIEEPTTHHAQMVKLIKDHFGDKEIVGLEIGTAAADLTKTLLWALPNLRLYTVDPWTHEPGNLFEAGHPQEELSLIKEHAYKALEEFNQRVAIMPMKSDDAFKEIYEKVDFVHLDGDHTISTVKREIKSALVIIKTGGFLSGHDYPTIKEAIDFYFPDQSVNKGADLTWWVYV